MSLCLPPTIVAHADALLTQFKQLAGLSRCSWSGETLLGMRARLMRLTPTDLTSANGSCHLMQCQDERWIALNLSRPCDWELLPALFQYQTTFTTVAELRAHAATCDAHALVEQGRLLGLAIALVPAKLSQPAHPAVPTVCNAVTLPAPTRAPRVLDLSALWAGPLCSQLLQEGGADVTTVESLQRPDGARLNSHPGAQQFYQQLHRGKQHLVLDFSSPQDLQQLHQLIASADIVIEGSRPRALQQLGIDATKIVKTSPGKTWVSITGYGRATPPGNWIAYGDDAAAAAGLVYWENNRPRFIGDAIADPLTGVTAAFAALQCWQRCEPALLDISLYQVARAITGA